MSRDHLTVDQEVELSIDVLADSAQANLSFGNIAISGACGTSDSELWKRLVKLCFTNHEPYSLLFGRQVVLLGEESGAPRDFFASLTQILFFTAQTCFGDRLVVLTAPKLSIWEIAIMRVWGLEGAYS
jgi:hypothetical protein